MHEHVETSKSDELKVLARDPNTQASLLLIFGPAIWKWISNISNVDFLLSINGEKFNMFLSFLQGPGWMVLTAVGLIWTFANYSFRSYVTHKTGPNWVLVICITIISFLFGILATVYSTGGVPAVFSGVGSIDSRVCSANVDMKRLLSFRKDYRLAVVCGYNDASKDRLEDENITVSNRFTITGSVQSIVTQASQKMAQRTEELTKEATKNSPNPTQQIVVLATWYTAILLPNDVPTSKIAKLQDVLNLGGKILDSQYFNN